MMPAALLGVLTLAAAGTAEPDSVFLPKEAVRRARTAAQATPWGRKVRDRILAAAAPWTSMSDDALWELMFGNTIKRSWMVWSNGHCPACKRDVPMYTWEVDALRTPWKVRCPHCRELFPKNDFAAFYKSGLDARGIFDPAKADRSLLYNADHPNPGDALRHFGVDDGEGYVDGDKRWRFIGAYLIYGQWKQAIVAGIRNLAAAYVLTGDRGYAHRAGVLLDRVADLYPSFDFGKEGVMYEGPPTAGYVSTWHDACEETRGMALAYDQVRGALSTDGELVRFLSEKARKVGLANAKRDWADVRRNIEDGLLRDPLTNRHRIHSNYPRTEIALATITMVLGWPDNRADVWAIVDPMLEKATAVDGVTGEKGLAGYTSFTLQGVAVFLAQLARLDRALFSEVIRRHPAIRDMFRFHVDTWCLGAYYPQTGDTGGFALPVRRYVGVAFVDDPGIEPSMYSLMAALSEETGDDAFAQLAYLANGRSVRDLPRDLFADRASDVRKRIAAAVRRSGPEPIVGSVNKRAWRLAILRSGRGADARALWLDYDSGGAHGHMDALNIGLFAHGLDLLPEFGYPPVQYGGWGSPRARWYTITAAHNTVVVDGANQRPSSGDCLLWSDTDGLRAVSARCAGAPGVHRFERAVALCDTSPRSSYVVDIMRVAGGSEHVKYQHSHFGSLSFDGFEPTSDIGPPPGAQMQGIRLGRMPSAGLIAEWRVEDRLKLLATPVDVRLRHFELTRDADAGRGEAWLAIGGYNGTQEVWIPRLVVRRSSSTGDLESTFVAVLEPYGGTPQLVSARRLDVADAGSADRSVAIEVIRVDGTRDYIVHVDGAVRGIDIAASGIRIAIDAGMCRIEVGKDGRVRRIASVGARRVGAGDYAVTVAQDAEPIDIAIAAGMPRVVAGSASIEALTVRGKPVSRRD